MIRKEELMMSCHIKHLQKNDWVLWKEIRLEALKRHPEAFGGTYEEECLWSDEDFKLGLVKSDIFGAFIDNRLVGVAGIFVIQSKKLKHKGTLFSLYVKNEKRGQGIADQLVKAVINHVRQRVLQLHCTVVTNNNSALKLYQRHGFQIYGTEPRSLKVNEKFYDEHLMVLKFE